jgi:hypothetical protein
MASGADDGKRGVAALWGGEARPVGGALLCAVMALLAYAVRYRFVEPEAMGAACERTQPWWCPVRTGFIVFTQWRGFGWLALGCAVAALIALLAGRVGATRWLAAVALAAGGAGMILYNAAHAIPAVVIAGLCLVRAR